NIRRRRRLVRLRPSGKVRDLAAQRLRVQPLLVAADELVERAVDEGLDERRLVRSPDFVPHLAVGRNGGGDDDDAVSRQQAGNVADAADVGVAILLRKAEPLAQIGADLVAVEDLDAAAARRQLVADRPRQRRLPRTRQAGEPERKPAHARIPSISTCATSARVNSGGGTWPFVSMSRTCVPLSVTRLEPSC